jgi:hypothetical protein
MTAWLISGACIALSFWLLKKKQPTNAFIGMFIAFVIFAGAVFEKTLSTPSFEQIICWVFAAFTLRMAFTFLQSDKHAEALLVFFSALFMFACGLSAVQGLLRTGILTKVNDSVIEYSKKLDGFQTEIEIDRSELQTNINTAKSELLSNIDTARLKLETDISAARTQGKEQQNNIEDQFRQIAVLQSKLAIAESNIYGQFTTNYELQRQLAIEQSNLDAQQSRLSNIEFQVNSLFLRTTVEAIRGDDTNNAFLVKHQDGGAAIAFKLSSAAITNSIFIWAIPDSPQFVNPQTVLLPPISANNIVICPFIAGADTNTLKSARYLIQYVKDSPNVRRFKTVTIDGEYFIADGLRILDH